MKKIFTPFHKLFLSVVFGWAVVLGTWIGYENHQISETTVVLAILLLSLRYRYLARFNWSGMATAAIAGFSFGLFFGGDEGYDFPGSILVGIVVTLMIITFTGIFVSAYNLLKETLILIWQCVRAIIRRRQAKTYAS